MYTTLYPAEKNPQAVKYLQTLLRNHGYQHIIVDGIFGKNTLAAVRAFQSTHLDAWGKPLYVDGIVNNRTWSVLQSPQTLLDQTPTSFLQLKAIEIAGSQIGVSEHPKGSNRGADVEKYQKSVCSSPGSPWCAAFVYWCFQQASLFCGCHNPLVKTAHCLTHWNKSQGHRISSDFLSNLKDAELGNYIKTGSIFIIDNGQGKGHTGLVFQMNGNTIETIEGNTNNNRSREGIGVFLNTRNISEINTGFINYG